MGAFWGGRTVQKKKEKSEIFLSFFFLECAPYYKRFLWEESWWEQTKRFLYQFTKISTNDDFSVYLLLSSFLGDSVPYKEIMQKIKDEIAGTCRTHALLYKSTAFWLILFFTSIFSSQCTRSVFFHNLRINFLKSSVDFFYLFTTSFLGLSRNDDGFYLKSA